MEGEKSQEVGDIGTIYYSFAYRIISLLVTGIYYLPPEAKKREDYESEEEGNIHNLENLD